MKKILFFAVLGALALGGCGKSDNSQEEQQAKELANQKALAEATREELETAVAERDELLSLINEISSNVSEIQNVEHIVSMNRVGEGTEKENIQNNLNTLKTSLAERRQRLINLENKLKESKLTNDGLLATIETLKKQIDEQTQTIETLTLNLDKANKRIDELGNEVNSLNTQVATVTEERDQAQADATRQADIANICYYAIGSKKELKEHKILESGFLKKTKVMQGEFDKTYFTQADKRTLTVIPLHSNKAKIVSTSQPAGSYQIVEENGQKVLKITNPSEFWGVSNYVVIQID